MSKRNERATRGATAPRREPMHRPEDVEVTLRVHAQGWRTQRIAEDLGFARNTVRRYRRQGGWQPYGRARRSSQPDGQLGTVIARTDGAPTRGVASVAAKRS